MIQVKEYASVADRGAIFTFAHHINYWLASQAEIVAEDGSFPLNVLAEKCDIDRGVLELVRSRGGCFFELLNYQNFDQDFSSVP